MLNVSTDKHVLIYYLLLTPVPIREELLKSHQYNKRSNGFVDITDSFLSHHYRYAN